MTICYRCGKEIKLEEFEHLKHLTFTGNMIGYTYFLCNDCYIKTMVKIEKEMCKPPYISKINREKKNQDT